MQARRRLVEHVERVARRAPGQLGRQLHALGLSPRKRRRGLAQAHVPESHVHQALDVAQDPWLAVEEIHRIGDRHVEHVTDRLAAVLDLEGLAVIAGAVARLTVHVDVG